MIDCAVAAREAFEALRFVPYAVRQRALFVCAEELIASKVYILSQNSRDVEAAEKKQPKALLDRLLLDDVRLEACAESLNAIAILPDPLGRVLARWQRPSGLDIQKISVPIGVIGLIYEARPNVTCDVAGLCIASGNSCILRPGAESWATAQALLTVLHKALKKVSLPTACISLLPSSDRAHVDEMLACHQHIDLIVPRGGKGLIEHVRAHSKVPVLSHLDGNCHIYVHESAKLEMAMNVIANAKMRRTSICSACESLLVDKAIAADFLPTLAMELSSCELRGCETACSFVSSFQRASEDDWAKEYLAPVLSIKVVEGLDEAIGWIEKYGSHHTDAIIAEDPMAVEAFFATVDSAVVMHNTSTQFSDGGEFGFGAEVGIATGRLHARGPVGTAELTTYKYLVTSEGAVRA